MSSASKPYLDWLDRGANPPAALSTVGWTSAAGVLIDRLRAARNAMATDDILSAVEDYCLAGAKLMVLNTWADHLAPRTPRIRANTVRTETARIRRAMDRVALAGARSGVLPMLDGLLRRRRQPLTPVQKVMVEEIANEWREAKNPVGLKRGRQQEAALAKHFRVQEIYQAECQANGILLTRAQVQELPPFCRAQARLAARQQGWSRGWFVTADSDLGREAMAYLSDRSLRESLWRQRQAIRDTAGSVSEVLRLRHAEALAEGFNHYAAYQVSGRAVGQVRTVSALMTSFLDQTRPASNHLDRRLACLAAELSLGEIQPWDRPWLIEKLRSKQNFGQEPGQSFGLSTVIDTILPELLMVDGWEVGALTVVGEGRRRQWVYDLEKAEPEDPGCPRRAQLWFAPFNPRTFETPNEGGYEISVSDCWSAKTVQDVAAARADEEMSAALNAPGVPVVTIVLGFKPATRWLNLQEMTWVVHETGHALHDLSLSPQQHNYTLNLSTDIIEFPSQFLERLAQDPQTLARWCASSPGSDPASHKSAFWKRFLNTDIESIDLSRQAALYALYDLHVHRRRLEDGDSIDPQALYAKLCARHGIACHEDDRMGYSRFGWENYPASDYTYTFGVVLSRLLLPLRADGTVDGDALKAVFSDLSKHVLSPGIDGPRFARAWRAWCGESLRDSIARGSKYHASDLRVLSRTN
jgi:hypothetical protein